MGKNYYFTNDMLFDTESNNIDTKELKYLHNCYTAGVAYDSSDVNKPYVAYSTNERGIVEEKHAYSAFIDAVNDARKMYQNLSFEMDYVTKSINKHKKEEKTRQLQKPIAITRASLVTPTVRMKYISTTLAKKRQRALVLAKVMQKLKESQTPSRDEQENVKPSTTLIKLYDTIPDEEIYKAAKHLWYEHIQQMRQLFGLLKSDIRKECLRKLMLLINEIDKK